MNATTVQISEERTFTARLNERSVTGLIIESAWEGLTKYVRQNGDHLIVMDADARIVTGSPALLDILDMGQKPMLAAGEIYVGIADGQHVILLPGDTYASWGDCMAWAKSIGGDLPTRAEQKLLFEKAKDQFKPEWYWSNTQHAGYSGCAWSQGFSHGFQGGLRKSLQWRARAVRRLAI